MAPDRIRSGRWVHWAICTVEADANRSADTHLLPFPLPREWGVDLFLKDESVHPTGSLVTLLCDSGMRYGATYFGDEWIAAQGLDPAAAAERLALPDALVAM